MKIADDAIEGGSVNEKLRIYIAAPFKLQHAGKALRDLLEHTHQMVVTSSWLDEDPNGSLDALREKERTRMALRDESDMATADAMVAINPPDFRDRGTGGRHAELGYMIACGKPIFILGARSNVYHYHPLVRLATYDPITLGRVLRQSLPIRC